MIHLERCEAEMALRYFHCTCGLYSSYGYVQHCLCSNIFIVAFPVLILVSMAHASFVDLPLWRDRPPSQALFDFNRYEYRLRLCQASCPRRYCGQWMPGNEERRGDFLCFHTFRDGDFRRDEELELCAIHTGADYIVGRIVGHEDPSGTPAWIVYGTPALIMAGLEGLMRECFDACVFLMLSERCAL